MTASPPPPGPDDATPTSRPLSAGPLELARIAARGVASLLRPSPAAVASAGGPGAGDDRPLIVSPDTRREQRIPPGQVKTGRWPVLHAGTVPKIDLARWSLEFRGLVETPVSWTWDALRALPGSRVLADMHCVTHWSRLDNQWEGVLVRDLMERVQLQPGVQFVLVHAEQGFTTNLPLSEFLGDDCLFAWAHNGVPLSADHGAPLRLVVPRLYAWKSAKWVRAVEFRADDQPGFWEQNGYHRLGDPWSEQRYW